MTFGVLAGKASLRSSFTSCSPVCVLRLTHATVGADEQGSGYSLYPLTEGHILYPLCDHTGTPNSRARTEASSRTIRGPDRTRSGSTALVCRLYWIVSGDSSNAFLR